MEAPFSPPKPRIIFFSQQSLHSSVLLGYLQQKLNIESQTSSLPQWRDIWTAAQRPTLVLIDAELARPERIVDLLEQIYDQALDVRVAFLGVSVHHPVEKMIVWPMVAGMFYTDCTQQQLSKGVSALFEGEYWLPRHLIHAYLQCTRKKPKRLSASLTSLTKREGQIIRRMGTGATNIEIAAELHLSMHTIKTHIYNLFKKLGVANRMQAVNWAKENLDEFSDLGRVTSRNQNNK